MNHQFVGRPIGKVESLSLEVDDAVTQFGSGVLYDPRTLAIAEAVRAGRIEGEIYADGEVWADPRSLTGFLAAHIPA